MKFLTSSPLASQEGPMAMKLVWGYSCFWKQVSRKTEVRIVAGDVMTSIHAVSFLYETVRVDGEVLKSLWVKLLNVVLDFPWGTVEGRRPYFRSCRIVTVICHVDWVASPYRLAEFTLLIVSWRSLNCCYGMGVPQKHTFLQQNKSDADKSGYRRAFGGANSNQITSRKLKRNSEIPAPLLFYQCDPV